jgi:hypothetical protein
MNSGRELVMLSASIFFIGMDELKIYPTKGKAEIIKIYIITTENVSATDLK